MTWQSIETAPKDGTRIMLFRACASIPIAGGYWSDHKECRCWIVGGYMAKVLPPSHWQPLPPPPTIG